MLQPLTSVSLPQTYCRSCHLSTRSDVPRCLHCNKSLREPVAAPRKKTVFAVVHRSLPKSAAEQGQRLHVAPKPPKKTAASVKPINSAKKRPAKKTAAKPVVQRPKSRRSR